MTVHVRAAGRTHVGLVRRRNEDQFYVGRSLLAIADGLGGHVAGDVASETVIEVLKKLDREKRFPPGHIARAISDANTALRAKVDAEPTLTGMGTTLVALAWSEIAAVLANIGDSRAYLLHRSEDPEALSQITEDHTYGHLVADAASVPLLPDRLARYLDGRPDGRSPDLSLRSLHAGDRFLLCSDGLSSYVPHNEITEAMTAAAHPEDAADRLIALAIDHGGHDNVTVIVADIES